MTTNRIENRGSKQVEEGEVNNYGQPQELNHIQYGGLVQFQGDKLVGRPMNNGKGDILSFNVLRRQELAMQVSCFGDLANQVKELLRNRMRVTVEGRLRVSEQTQNGRKVRYINISAQEVGIWDNEMQVHWIQYDPGMYLDQSYVEPLLGDQGGVIGPEDLAQRAGGRAVQPGESAAR